MQCRQYHRGAWHLREEDLRRKICPCSPVRGHRLAVSPGEPTAELPKFWKLCTNPGLGWKESRWMWDLQPCDGISPKGSLKRLGPMASFTRPQEGPAPGKVKSLQLSDPMGSSLLSFSFPAYPMGRKYSLGLAASRSLSAISMNSGRLCRPRRTSPRDRTPDSGLRETRARMQNGIPAAVSFSLSTQAQATQPDWWWQNILPKTLQEKRLRRKLCPPTLIIFRAILEFPA